MSARVTLCLLVTLLGARPRAAGAQVSPPETPQALFERGRTAFEERRYAGALDAFLAAYELAPYPALLFNIARAHQELGDYAAARAEFLRYLAVAPVEQRDEVAARVAEVEQQRKAGATLLPWTTPPASPSPAAKARKRTRLIVGLGIASVTIVGLGIGLGLGLRKHTTELSYPAIVVP